MKSKSSVVQHRLPIACAVVAAAFCMTAGAQEVVKAKASVSASHADKLQKFKEDGFSWYEVVSKETYSASATFILDAVPEDWTELAQAITVTVGGLECSPDIVKSTAKGGSAKWKEKDKEMKSSVTCSVKWSKKNITVSLSGSNYDGTTVVESGDDGFIDESVALSVDLGAISIDMSVPVRGKGKTVIKTIKTGKGEDATEDEYSLVSWKAKGSAIE